MSTTSQREAKAGSGAARTSAQAKSAPVKVAYIVSRFPKLTETFVLFEILAIEKRGITVELLPLMKARNCSTHPEGASLAGKTLELLRRPQPNSQMHPEARPLVNRAHFVSWYGWTVFMAQVFFLSRSPWAYMAALGTVIRHAWGSANFLLGGLVLFPKAVYFARRTMELGITHVHAHFANHPTTAALIIHRLTGISYSFTAHGSDIQADQHMLAKKVAAAEFVVTVSNYNKELLIKECGERYRNRINVTRCGVDTQFFQPTLSRKRSSRLNIICVGTLYEVKGQIHVIEACALLRQRGVDFCCHLVGDGPLREQLQDRARRLEVDESVCFHGKLVRSELVDLLREMDVLCAPSVPARDGRREGIPVALMEAMASGLPVVASEISGIPELVQHYQTGLLVPPRDAKSLADALQHLHDHEALRRRLSRAGRETIVREYDLDKNVESLVTQFRTRGKRQ